MQAYGLCDDECGNFAFSPDGQYMALLSAGGYLKVFSVNMLYLSEVYRRAIPASIYFSIEFSPDGKLLALAGIPGAVVFAAKD